MNTGIPAVSGEGAMGVIEPFEISIGDVKADQFVDANKMVSMPELSGARREQIKRELHEIAWRSAR